MSDALLAGIIRRDLAASREQLLREAEVLADDYARMVAALKDPGRTVSSIGSRVSTAAARAGQLAQELNRLIGMTEIADVTLPKEGA